LSPISEDEGISEINVSRESLEIEFSRTEFSASRTWQEAHELALCASQPFLMEFFFFGAFNQCVDHVRKTDINQS